MQHMIQSLMRLSESVPNSHDLALVFRSAGFTRCIEEMAFPSHILSRIAIGFRFNHDGSYFFITTFLIPRERIVDL